MEEEDFTYDSQLFVILCDYYWYAVRGLVFMNGEWHKDEQGETFAERVMEFIKQELETHNRR